jgi:hypothetical protein
VKGALTPGCPAARKNHIHQKTAKLIAKHSLIVTEDLSIENMTASANGTDLLALR